MDVFMEVSSSLNSVEVHDISGKRVANFDSEGLNVSSSIFELNLRPFGLSGMYFVTFKTAKGTATKKIVIQ